MPRQPCTMVRHHANYRLSKGESSLLLRPSTDATGQRKPRPNNKHHLRRTHALHTLRQWQRTKSWKERPIRKHLWHYSPNSAYRECPIRKDNDQTFINNVLHVLTIANNLISVGQIVEQGNQVRFNHKGCFIEKEGRGFILDSHRMKSTMFTKGHKFDSDIELCKKETAISIFKSSRACSRMESSLDSPLSKKRRLKVYVKPANSANNMGIPFPKKSKRKRVPPGRNPLKCVGTGTNSATFHGCRYYVTFIDGHSTHTWIYPMCHKNQVFTHFYKFKKGIEKETGRHVRCLRLGGRK